MMPDNQNIWETTLTEVKNNIEQGVNVWEENNKNPTDTVKALIQQLRQMVIVLNNFLTPEAVAASPITYQIVRSNYQLLNNNKPTIWVWTGNDLRYFDKLISEQMEKIETVITEQRARNQQRQASAPNPAPAPAPENAWEAQFKIMQEQFNTQRELTQSRFEQLEKAKEDEIAALNKSVDTLKKELEDSKSQALVIKNQESQLAIVTEDNKKLKGILEVILSTLKDSGITMETIEGKSIEEVEKIIAEKQQLLLAGSQRETQSINHHARPKYEDLGQIFAYSEPPRNQQEQESWKKANPLDYQKYKLDISVSSATYYAMLKLAEYHKTLPSVRSPLVNGKSAANERELVSKLIYTLALQELRDNFFIEQNISNSKKSLAAEGLSEGCCAQLDTILAEIQHYSLSNVFPKTELKAKAALLEQLSAGSLILPKNDDVQKEFKSLREGDNLKLEGDNLKLTKK